MSDIYLQITETPTVVTLSAPVVSGALSSTVTVANTVTVALDANSLSALENVTVTVGAAITGTVTVGNSVTISSLPAISGTVTANVVGTNGYTAIPLQMAYNDESFNDGRRLAVSLVNSEGLEYTTPLPISGTVTVGNTVTIAGTVTANPTGTQTIAGSVTIGAGTQQIGSVTASISGTVPVSGTFYQATQPVSLASTTVTVSSLPALAAGTAQIGSVTVGNSVTIASLPALVAGTAQIGSVTASISANPSGALTTRFGSVTTANTAQITTAVTNTSRKYLFAQNISIGSVTMGIGFSPTTTQGIQLSAGSGIVFDSFCPTGAVYWLGATTGAAWSILEG